MTVIDDVGELAIGRTALLVTSCASASATKRPSSPWLRASATSPSVIIATNQAARDAGAKAGALAKQAASTLGGGGGGKDDLAQGGGSDVAAIGSALDGIRAALKG